MERNSYTKEIKELLKDFPVVALLGARQVGKTTISREFAASHRFDLENPRDLTKFENPQLLLEDLEGLVVIDEIQRKKELFPLIRFLVDRPKTKIRFLILGSASRDLIRQSSESLAGRIHYVIVNGFDLSEISNSAARWKRHWIRGSYPNSFLARNEEVSRVWREQYISTFLERDIPLLGITIPAETLRRFWIMVSHYHGQLVNYSELGKSFGISDMTVRKYLEILVGTFMVTLIPPWYENTGKRLTKQPKIYIRDSGIFHSLQSIESAGILESHPKLGASFEGYVISQMIAFRKSHGSEFFFYRTHQGTEVDLLWMEKGRRYGLEVKYTDAPTKTKSMAIAIDDLNLDKLFVVYPGKDSYKLEKNIEVVPVFQISIFRK